MYGQDGMYDTPTKTDARAALREARAALRDLERAITNGTDNGPGYTTNDAYGDALGNLAIVAEHLNVTY